MIDNKPTFNAILKYPLDLAPILLYFEFLDFKYLLKGVFYTLFCRY